MQYFSFLPKIEYDNVYTIRNLFHKYYFSESIPDEYLYDYVLKDGENLETLSFDVYGDPVFWWLLALVNNIRDTIFDLPLNSTVLQKIATSKSTVNGSLNLETFSEIYDSLETENDQKRNIQILKFEYLNDVLTNMIRST